MPRKQPGAAPRSTTTRRGITRWQPRRTGRSPHSGPSPGAPSGTGSPGAPPGRRPSSQPGGDPKRRRVADAAFTTARAAGAVPGTGDILRYRTVRPATFRAYTNAVQRLKGWAQWNGRPLTDPTAADPSICAFLEHLFMDGQPKGHGILALYGLRFFVGWSACLPLLLPC